LGGINPQNIGGLFLLYQHYAELIRLTTADHYIDYTKYRHMFIDSI
jgi:hypothetical protein